MILALLRHGIAEDAGPRTGYRDEPRELTPTGAERMRLEAEGIALLRIAPDAIVCSPLARCEQTARIVGGRLGVEVHTHRGLRPGARTETVLEIVSDHADAECLLVCGHQPDMSLMAGDLIGGGVVEFRKGSLALLTLHRPRPGGAVLEALYPPAALRLLAGA